MKRYKIVYLDGGEECKVHFKGESNSDAEENFWDWIHDEWGGPEGIQILYSIKVKK